MEEHFRTQRPRPGFAFCKTERKPYDVIICAALMAIKHHTGDNVVIYFDGDFAEETEWAPAYTLYRTALRRDLPPFFAQYIKKVQPIAAPTQLSLL